MESRKNENKGIREKEEDRKGKITNTETQKRKTGNKRHQIWQPHRQINHNDVF